MNNRYSLLTTLVLAAYIGKAQNVGIGILSPQAKLHVFSTDNTAVLAETNTVSKYAGFEAKTNAGVNDNLFVRKWMPGSSGSMAGVNLSNLSLVVAGVQAGPLLVGVANNNPLYFTTNNLVRMQIASNGSIGINTDPESFYQLKVVATSGTAIHARAAYIPDISHFATSITGTVDALQLRAVGVYGEVRSQGGSLPLIQPGVYGVAGTALDSGYAVGALAGDGAGALLARAETPGKALKTIGDLQLTEINEGAGKVLTSDASGNATWESLPASAGTWAVSGNNIYNTNSGNVGINTGIPSARLSIRNPSADTSAFLITHPGGFRVTRINGNRELYHEGDLFVHSAWGKIRYGYADKGWFFGTINGGQDLQLWSHSTTDVDASRVRRLVVEGITGDVLINNDNASDHAQLRVERGAGAGIVTSGNLGAIAGLNQNTASGSGVYGVSGSGAQGAIGYAGVTGQNVSTGPAKFGVIGMTNGDAFTAGLYSAGVGGYGQYGVLGWTQSSAGAGMIAQHSDGKTALEINNGFIKATGTNKTAFIVTTGPGNTSGNTTLISYLNPEATDIIIVTHNWQGNYMGAIGVYYTLGVWRLFREDGLTMPAGEKFNVMVIKQ